MVVAAGTGVKAATDALSLSTQGPGSECPGPLPMYSCWSQRQGPQPSARLKSSLQTLCSILCELQRDGPRNANKKEGICLFQFPSSLAIPTKSRLKMAAPNESPPVCSLRSAAFEHYSRSQQINIAALPYRLSTIIRTLS